MPMSRPETGPLARLLATSLVCLTIAGCATSGPPPNSANAGASAPALALVEKRKTPPRQEKFPVPDVDMGRIPKQFHKQTVDYPTAEPVGTVIVDPGSRFLYLVQPGGKALRYGVGVGAAGRAFSGTADLAYKREWPRWTPTPNMIKRNPERYGKHAGGVDGGPGNPMGARALYLFQDGVDTLYRIHGTNEPSSIGKAVSAGCIRMLNQDVIDLYDRVGKGAKVIVK
ncbi:L,D-transpeptidase [Arvimicrobium flavum]|uniref:L,D-transpeptidase n=1 Tax=Arvimicrobium flavum TaxID=3393320 RepID=UPI00237AAD6D|nr:L,D-transpeptidase [Mesorhizobium shangrilense]